MALLTTDRQLRCWEFTVSLRQLLLRSPKGETGQATNLDVIFLGVRYMQLPTELNGLIVSEGEATHVAQVERAIGGSLKLNRVFVLRSGHREFLNLAAAMRVEENTLDLMKTSTEFSRIEAQSLKPR